jgi:hypothetical protein
MQLNPGPFSALNGLFPTPFGAFFLLNNPFSGPLHHLHSIFLIFPKKVEKIT